MLAPGPKLVASLEVLYRAALEARLLGWAGERAGLGIDESKKLADLMDAVHNVPRLAADWERCDEQQLRSMLGEVRPAPRRMVAEHSRSS